MTQKFLVVSCCFCTLRLFYKCFASELLAPPVKDKGKNILATCKDKIGLIMSNQFVDVLFTVICLSGVHTLHLSKLQPLLSVF